MTVLPNLGPRERSPEAEACGYASPACSGIQAQGHQLKVTAPKADGKGTSGAISIYGLGRFPITLYRSQLERLIGAVPQINAFIKTNSALLATKD